MVMSQDLGWITMAQMECLGCGHVYTSKSGHKTVKSCSHCTKRFPDEDVDLIVAKIMQELEEYEVKDDVNSNK